MSLILSIAMLALAPLIYSVAVQFQRFWTLTRRLIIVAVTLMVVLHLLPESISALGWPAVGLALIGLVLPSLLERMWHQQAGKIHSFSLIIGLLGLVVHGLIDGAAFSECPSGSADMGGGHHHHHHHHDQSWLQAAVLLHRLPEALIIWSLFYPKRGPFFPSALLALLALSTFGGYYLGEEFLAIAENNVMLGFQALVSGSLLHLALDRHDHSLPAEEEACCDHHHH